MPNPEHNPATTADVELELDLLRAIMHNPRSIGVVTRFSADPYFIESERLRPLWQSYLTLQHQNQAIDPAIVRSVAVTKGFASQTDIDRILEDVVSVRESDANIEDWARQLFELYSVRETYRMLDDARVLMRRGESMDNVRSLVAGTFSALSGARSAATLKQVAGQVFEEARTMRGRGSLRVGLRPTTPGIFQTVGVGGIGDNWLITIGAESGGGKTSLAMNLVYDAVTGGSGLRAGVVSLEMTPEVLTERLYASRAGLAFDKVRAYDFDDGEWARFETAKAEIDVYGDRLTIWTQEDFSGAVTADKIFSLIQAEHAKDPFGLVMLDYFQLFSGKDLSDKEEASKTVNRIAKQLRIPVILISQFSHAAIRESRAPRADDLKGTGQIKHDSDLIYLIDRLDMRIPRDRWATENVRGGLCHLIVGKFRHGPIQVVPLLYHGPSLTFMPASAHEDFWTDMIPDDLQGRNDLSRVVHGGAAPVDAAARRAVPSFMTQRAVTASPPA